MNRVAIIGGGASGLFAAIVAAKNGAEVTIYERSNRVGKKLLATGNGRCNFTNTKLDSSYYHGSGKGVVKSVLESFSVQDTLDFFDDLGIFPYFGEDGKVFPNSLQASSVLDVLRYECEKLGVEEQTDEYIVKLRKTKDGFDIITNKEIYEAKNVIVCTGGMAGSQFGCDGSGYKFAKDFGMKVSSPFPALVQLKCNDAFLKRISGVKFEGTVKILSIDKSIPSRYGEILFTDYGISGPPILQMSRHAIDMLNDGKEVTISLDMFNEYSEEEVYSILRKRFNSDKNLVDSMIGLVNKKLIPVLLSFAIKEYKSKKCSSVVNSEIRDLARTLKDFRLHVSGSKSWNQAQTTAGGVIINEIDIETMKSRKVDGLYFAGEVIDTDGDCGGYNLQWAWSSAYIAGTNAAYDI